MEDRAVGPYVGKPFAQLLEHSGADSGDHAGGNLHLKKAPDDSEETDSVQKKTRTDSEIRDQQSRRGGTKHPRAVEHHRVERDRVGEIFVANHLDYERLPPGHVE